MPVSGPPERIEPGSLDDYLEVMSKSVFQSSLSWRVVEAKLKTGNADRRTRPIMGVLRIAEIDPAQDRHRFSRRVGVLFAEDSLYKSLSPLANLEFGCSLYGLPKSRAAQVLVQVGTTIFLQLDGALVVGSPGGGIWLSIHGFDGLMVGHCH